MKPPIEYRPKPKPKISKPYADVGKRIEVTEPIVIPSFITIRRDRAKYNAYMRAYRKRKKEQKP